MVLIVYSRPRCQLCEEFIAELDAWCRPRGLSFDVHDVDADPATRAAYGLRIPVLALEGVELMAVHFDPTLMATATGGSMPG